MPLISVLKFLIFCINIIGIHNWNLWGVPDPNWQTCGWYEIPKIGYPTCDGERLNMYQKTWNGKRHSCCCDVIMDKTKNICDNNSLKPSSKCEKESWRDQTVVSGEYYTRPMQNWMSKLGVADHHGVVLTTDLECRWLIHSTPSDGVVVTEAGDMKKTTWTKRENFPCFGDKTVDQVFKVATGRTTIKLINYITSGTCIYTAEKAEAYCADSLESEPESKSESEFNSEAEFNSASSLDLSSILALALFLLRHFISN